MCGAKTFVTITAYGDYDGPDGPRETDPCDCATCAGIKLANPTMHTRLMALWEQIKQERQQHKKRLKEVQANSYTQHDLYSIFHTPYLENTLAKMYQKEVSELVSCTDSKDPNDPWVRSEAAKTFAFRVIDIAIGKRKVSPTYR